MKSDLTSQLEALAAATDPARDPIEVTELPTWRPHRSSRRVSTLRRVAVALVAIGGVGAVVMSSWGEPGRDGHVASSVPSPPSETTNADLLDPGETRVLPAAPIDGRFGAATAWTGTHVFLWGGDDERIGRNFADGATFDVRGDEWRVLPPAPLRARSDAEAVWTGTEVLVWGGFASKGLPEGEDPERSDGAAYDPATGTWRRIADAPVTDGGDSRAVWTGAEMIVLPGRRSVGTGRRESVVAAAYNPIDDRWRTIADPPGPLGTFPEAVWTGERVVAPLQDTDSGDVMGVYAYDPAEDTWEDLGRPPQASYTDRLVWTGDRILVIPVDTGRRPTGRDPETGRWVPVGDPAPAVVATTRRAPVALWTGRRVVLWGPGFMATFDPVPGTWAVTGESHQPTDADAGVSAVWADGVLFVWGGFPAVADGSLIRPPDRQASQPDGMDVPGSTASTTAPG